MEYFKPLSDEELCTLEHDERARIRDAVLNHGFPGMNVKKLVEGDLVLRLVMNERRRRILTEKGDN
jgi:hypothetical protein